MAKNPLAEIDWRTKGLRVDSKSDEIQFNAALEFLQFYDVKKHPTIVDVGSGPGHQAFVLSELGAKVVCVDPKKPVYERLEWIPPEKLSSLPGQSAVWSHHCLEHIRDPLGALIEWRRVLRPRGAIFLTVPQFDMTMSSGHINSYNLPLLVYHLAIAGFDTSEGRLMKRDSHIRAVATKSAGYEPGDDPVRSLSELAKLGLFSPSVAKAIEQTGRFTSEALTLRWFDRTWKPVRGGLDAVTYVNNSLWR